MPNEKVTYPDPIVVESELRDGYNVIDKNGHVVGTFADIAEAIPLMGNPGVAVCQHPPPPINRYRKMTPDEVAEYRKLRVV